jgi:mannose-6-phosphate isomerase-like protein (cupin superfamily)
MLQRSRMPNDSPSNRDFYAVNLSEKLSRFQEHWSPRIIAELNDYQIKLVKLEGEFVWHQHDSTDELFLCLEGNMQIEFRDGSVSLNQGDLFVVPRGIEHKPFATSECHAMVIEPKGVLNTGGKTSKLTAPNDNWV